MCLSMHVPYISINYYCNILNKTSDHVLFPIPLHSINPVTSPSTCLPLLTLLSILQSFLYFLAERQVGLDLSGIAIFRPVHERASFPFSFLDDLIRQTYAVTPEPPHYCPPTSYTLDFFSFLFDGMNQIVKPNRRFVAIGLSGILPIVIQIIHGPWLSTQLATHEKVTVMCFISRHDRAIGHYQKYTRGMLLAPAEHCEITIV
ncbi:hypothetical protein BU24DRAFT_198136 [Aaosphaeria arxii CBS 175.79]|uniref:Uncharacterized protein n=1 Tax=Aaosphaeria arxii CBS 175.79 TaxID=1450172 RepID=A0A6A5XTZ7_9PLEO|nr:uncharacterized protein BU24DRAFT_198136 [Aaosphaeria arxii CBS 175.79]KAF2016287.1 hypothetical protein BU24DRAFT_198136 [Aaosphaeria arxii CBS 175.79]